MSYETKIIKDLHLNIAFYVFRLSYFCRIILINILHYFNQNPLDLSPQKLLINISLIFQQPFSKNIRFPRQSGWGGARERRGRISGLPEDSRPGDPPNPLIRLLSLHQSAKFWAKTRPDVPQRSCFDGFSIKRPYVCWDFYKKISVHTIFLRADSRNKNRGAICRQRAANSSDFYIDCTHG